MKDPLKHQRFVLAEALHKLEEAEGLAREADEFEIENLIANVCDELIDAFPGIEHEVPDDDDEDEDDEDEDEDDEDEDEDDEDEDDGIR